MAFFKELLLVFLSVFSALTLAQEEWCVNDLLTKNPQLTDRFSLETLTEMCHRSLNWKRRSMLRSDSGTAKLSTNQNSWLNNVLTCEDLSCVCQLDASGLCGGSLAKANETKTFGPWVPLDDFLANPDQIRVKRQGPAPSGKAIRKEYRMLSTEERNRFVSAMNAIKNDLVDGKSKYDILIVYHMPEESPGAHFGPAFLPFHREMMKMMELVLRAEDFGVALPYWDSTLDSPLPDPTHSILWTEKLLGSGDGEVVDGPFEGFRTHPDPVVGHLSQEKRIVRKIGKSPYGDLFTEADLAQFRNIDKYSSLTFCVDPLFELVHGTVHMWIGGNMAQLRVSPNEPAFFLLHSFVDYLWEDWRQLKQTREQRENDYPSRGDSCSAYHYRDAGMKPFKILNKGGLRNQYTDLMYEYQPRPTCTKNVPDCGSEFLFCDTKPSNARCVSKVRLGGNCTGFENTDICYEGQCSEKVCVGVADDTTTTEKTTTTSTTTASTSTSATTRKTTNTPPPPPETTKQTTTTPSTTTSTTTTTTTTRPRTTKKPTCFDNNPCCPVWATGAECIKNKWMLSNCRKTCTFCRSGERGCIDSKPDCEYWASNNECKKNPSYMRKSCRAACKLCDGPSDELVTTCKKQSKPWDECKNYNAQCFRWAARDECRKNKWWMKRNCPLACGVCSK